ncbi:MAG: phospholipase D-like domain-containing protein, partial [Bacteroidales bacterium]|nr:phospholipase D-like domain-containing protein [Bacteroidales bacterium]
DRNMSSDCLKYLSETFKIQPEDMISDYVHLNMEDIVRLPNPLDDSSKVKPFIPLDIKDLEGIHSIFSVLDRKDVFLHYPYHRFDYFIRFLKESSIDPSIEEIKLTQYRVAQDSEVINALIDAARNGKKVTVFVELKARFDEENNLQTAQKMQAAGILIIYSIPKLKVHAKVALICGKETENSYAYLSTGNFNEKTAEIYSDMSVMISDRNLITELKQLFFVFETKNRNVIFDRLLVAQFNMNHALIEMIRREVEWAKKGKKNTGHIEDERNTGFCND